MDLMSKSKKFIYKNARPIDIARWNYLFEAGSKQEVIKYLKAFQNFDGGFANALEPDCWNKKSTPLQTWAATKIIKEIDFIAKDDALIIKILNYLASKDEFDGHHWNGLNTVKTNNDYPHAPWWSYTKDQETSYNPTASLIGFMLKYSNEASSTYKMACNLLKEAYSYFKNNFPLESMHEVACFVELYEYMKESDIHSELDLVEFKTLLQEQIEKVITYDTDIWEKEYVCKPSMFINSNKSDFYLANKDICCFEKQFIEQTQNIDGTWDVTWSWEAFKEAWAISKNWWKANIIIKNMLYMKNLQ